MNRATLAAPRPAALAAPRPAALAAPRPAALAAPRPAALAARRHPAATLAAVVLALAVLVAGPAPAAASLAGVSGSDFVYGPKEGEANNVTVSLDGASLVVTDRGVEEVEAQTGCAATADPQVVRCAVAGVANLAIGLGDQDDRLTITAPIPAQVTAGAGDDTVTGGPANDRVFGEAGTDSVSGGDGDDTLIELDSSPNRLDGGPGRDSLSGGSGPDVLLGGPGDDPVLAGREGDDVVDGGEGDDVLDPGFGPGGLLSDADRLSGGPGTDLVTFERRAQGVVASLGDGPNDGVTLEGDDIAADVERLAGSQGDDTLTGGAGADVLDGRGGRDTLDGGGGDDHLLGGADDTGDDTLRGGPGADVLDGGAGGDLLAGGDGTDRLRGGPGADALDGGPQDDVLDGEDGDDRLDGGAGADAISGGPGTDSVRYPGRTGAIEVTLDGVANDGEVSATADGRFRTVEGARSEGDDVDVTTENATGGGAADTLDGDAAPNAIDGGAGEDVLNGGGGADELSGGERSDAILARDGTTDRISCGPGYDYVIADPRDRIPTSARCEYVDDGSRTTPRARRDFAVAPHCAGRADAEISPPQTARAVPLDQRALVPVGARVDSLDCTIRLSVATRGGGTRSATLAKGSGEMQVTQRRGAGGALRTELRTSDCPQAATSGGVAHASRFPQRRYRRRYGRIAFPVTVRLDALTLQTQAGHGAVSWEVDDRCGDGATVRVTSGRLAAVDLGRDRRVVLGPGDTLKVGPNR